MIKKMCDPDSLTVLTESIVQFRDQRNWKQFHNPKDMAISLSLEVAELLELMQWKNGEDLAIHLSKKRKEVGEELSDILYWTLLLAHDAEINLGEAFRAKLIVNKEKYPVEKSIDSSNKYTSL